jgi:membrane-associated protein
LLEAPVRDKGRGDQLMETIKQFIDYFLHLDKYLGQVINTCGLWTYGVLFAIIFCETGLVIMPFLPGDSLLFAAGAFTATTSLQVGWMLVLLIAAAVLGDAVNYMVGYYAGEKIIQSKTRLIKQEHLDRTHEFFEKHGKMTIILARFVPIIRTFAPFVAGLGKMRYMEFAVYNVTGGVLWVSLFVVSGRLFGQNKFVKENFSLVILAIIILSVLPIAYEVWRQWRESRSKVADHI